MSCFYAYGAPKQSQNRLESMMKRSLRLLLIPLGILGAAPAVAAPPPVNLTAAEGAVLSRAATDAAPGATHRVILGLALSDDLAPTWIVDVSASEGWKVIAGKQHSLDAPSISGISALDTSVDLTATDVASEWLVLHVAVVDLDRRKDPLNWRLYFHRTGDALHRVDRELYFAKALGLTAGGPAVVTGGNIVFPDGPESVPPWDNPALPAELRARLAAERGAEVAVATGALTSVDPGADSAASEVEAVPQGCAGGGLPMGVLAVLAAGASLVWIGRRRGVAGIVTAVVALPVMAPSDASAVTHSVYGYIQYWDLRGVPFPVGSGSDEPGSRILACNTGITNCGLFDNDCCFSGVPVAEVKLWIKRPGQLNFYWTHGNITETDTNPTPGYFSMSDNLWASGTKYFLEVCFQNTGWPASYSVRTNADTLWCANTAQFEIPGSYLFGYFNLNSAGDSTSTSGDLAATWTSLHDSFLALEAENETRHRNAASYGDLSPNTYTPFKVRFPCSGGCSQATTRCSSNLIDLDDGYARQDVPSRAFGLMYVGRVMGCSVDNPAYPTWGASMPDMFTSTDQPEGWGLTAGLADVVPLLMRWDPDTADIIDVVSDYHDCDVTSHTNTNFASAARNNQLAIWEFLDTSTANPFPFYTDSVDLDLHDLMDSLLTLKGNFGSVGENRTNNEQYLNPTSTTCDYSDQCSAGRVCIEGFCKYGDPHGENIYDWMYTAAVDQGASTYDYRTTLSSSLCMTGYDNSYPFSYGYRED